MFPAILLQLSAMVNHEPYFPKQDEVVTIFPTLARRLDDEWCEVRIHGWIFEPETRSWRRRILLAGVRKSLGLSRDDQETELFRERASRFLVDNERDKALAVRVEGETHTLAPSEANGHFEGAVRVRLAADRDRAPIAIEVVTRDGDARRFHGNAFLLERTGVSIISDIDDTIKISEVRDHKLLLSNTFLKPFRPAPGMAEFYRRLGERGAAFHYVSASPWQLYEPLSRFLADHGFPAGSFHVKHFRWKDSTFFDLFADPVETKRRAIVPLLEAFPERTWVLIGDSGEKDPEIYGDLARNFPDRIARILIRDVTGEPRSDSRYGRAFDQVPEEKWVIFSDAAELASFVLPK